MTARIQPQPYLRHFPRWSQNLALPITPQRGREIMRRTKKVWVEGDRGSERQKVRRQRETVKRKNQGKDSHSAVSE